MKSRNPVTQKVFAEYSKHTPKEVENIVETVQKTWVSWKATSFEQRAKLMKTMAELLRLKTLRLGKLISMEMGKSLAESRAEVEKCAWVCDYYAEKAASFLKDEFFEVEGAKAFAAFEPLGVILAVMPWNFPFWQVFRFAAPGLMAGNGCVLKHASNVPGCAMAMEELFIEAGFPPEPLPNLAGFRQ